MSNSFDQTPVTTSKTPERVSNFVSATGRSRKAGYWLCGAGAAALFSALLPWGSDRSGDSLHPTGGGVLLVLAIGGLLAYFGSRILRDRPTKKLTTTLWIIAGLNAVVCVGFLASAGQANSEGGGSLSVQPTIGFYLGVAGFVAAVIGTVLMQTARRKNAATAQSVENGR